MTKLEYLEKQIEVLRNGLAHYGNKNNWHGDDNYRMNYSPFLLELEIKSGVDMADRAFQKFHDLKDQYENEAENNGR